MEETLNHQLHHLLLDIDLIYLGINKNILSKHGMRRVRYYTMRHLYLSPQLSLGELSHLTLVDRASLSRMVHTMEKDGLIDREADEVDRRLFKLSLTKDGESLFKRVQADMNADIQSRFEGLSDETKHRLLELNLELKHVLSEHAQAEVGLE